MSDGSVLIDTRLNTQGFSKGAADLKSQFKELGSETKKLGIAMAALFAVKKIIDFGKAAIQLGSDLQEVQNVVDVTFTSMSEKVNEFAASAAKTAGLSETMAKRYVGTFGAMAKSFRFTEGEAYEMATTLTQLSGDVASFYNITQAEAYTKLKSVFSGETETLKDLGVVMTQAALDDFALRKGLKKTTSQMSEQEKVSLRYMFVLEQLNAASGDFVRTSDSWANQTRILSLQFDQLKATIGQGLINALTPAVKLLNELLEKLQNLANDFKTLTEGIFGNASGGMSDAVGDAADNAGDLSENIQEAEKAAKSMISGFDELNVLSKATAEQTETPEDVVGDAAPDETEIPKGTPKWVERIKEILKELAEPLEKIDWKPAKEAVGYLLGALKDLAGNLGQKFLEFWKEFLGPVTETTIEERLPSFLRSIGNALNFVGDVVEFVWPVIKPILGFFTKLGDALLVFPLGILETVTGWLAAFGEVLNPEVVKKVHNFTEAEQALIDKSNAAADAFGKLATKTEGEEKEIQAKFDWTEKLWKELDKLADSDGKVLDINKDRASFILSELNKALGTEYMMVGNMITGYKNLKTEIQGVIAAKKANILLEAHEDDYRAAILSKETAWDAYDVLYRAEQAERDKLAEFAAAWKTESKYSKTLGRAVTGKDIEDQMILVDQMSINTEAALNNYLALEKTIAEYEEASRLIIAGDYEAASKLLLGRNTSFTPITEDIRSAAEQQMDVLKTELAEAERIAAQTKAAFEAGIVNYTKPMVDEAEAAVVEIKRKMAALNKVIELEAAGIMGLGFYTGGKVFLPGSWHLPFLASGAVIPPNAPFMAVLGDQRHGQNIEAPLSTIEEAVANVTAEQSEKMIGALYTLIDLVEQKNLSIQIGDETIGHANERYTQRRGVYVNTGAFANSY